MSTASPARSPSWPKRSAAATPTPRSPSSAPEGTTCDGSTSTSPSRTARDALQPRPRGRRRSRPTDRRGCPRGGRGAAIAALGSFRLLCAHRRGPYGVATWNAVVEGWLATELDRYAEDAWYVGRPLLVTQNDYGLRLYNGDTGVIVAARGRPQDRRLRAPRRARRDQPDPARGRRDRPRADDPQEPGLASRRRRSAAPRPELTDPDPGAAVHGRHPRAQVDDRLWDRGGHSRRTRASRSRTRPVWPAGSGARRRGWHG